LTANAWRLGLACAVALGLGLLTTAAALGAATGSFSATGSMGTPRNVPSAAALPDGRILLAGGYNGAAAVTSAEIFGPTSSTFSPTGSMGIARDDAAAAPLPDGRVLVAGGFTNMLPFYLATAETFDPATGAFSVTGSMTTPRSGAAAALLPDRRVLVAGGQNTTDPQFDLNSAEVYNSATGTFSAVPALMGARRYGVAAAPLPDGRVLIAGGYNMANGPLASAEIFDPATYTFSPTGSMGTRREFASASPLPDGRVLVAGGTDGLTTGLSSAEIFDPATNTFSPTASMGAGRDGPAAAPISDGRVLVAGGYNGTTYLSSAETFSLAKPSNALTFTVKGKRLLVTVAVPGSVSVAGVAGKLGTTNALSAKKKRKKLPLKPSSAAGGPGQVSVALKLAGSAKGKLKAKGKLRLRATVTFAPTVKPGECVAVFKQCYSSGFAASQTATLRLKSKKHEKK
jgi:hypothetical protein